MRAGSAGSNSRSASGSSSPRNWRSSQRRKPGIGRQRDEPVQLGQVVVQLLDDLLDERGAEVHAREARAGSSRSNRRPRCRRAPDRRRARVSSSSGASSVTMPVVQRDLDEHERFVGHRGMEEGVAAAIGVEPVLQVVPRTDRVHGFVLDELLEQRGRRVPRDARQREQADVEQRGECWHELYVEIGRAPGRRRRPAAASARRSTSNFTPPSRPVNRRRSLSAFGVSASRSARSAVRRSSARRSAVTASSTCASSDPELAGEKQEEVAAAVVGQREVRVGDRGGLGALRHRVVAAAAGR